MNKFLNPQKLTTFYLIYSLPVLASVESTLSNMQSTLISTILPLASILGLAWAGISFAFGNANARSHLFMAIIGAIIGFGAPSIIAFIRQMVN